MGQVLYRKYRSKKLDEIVGQEHITTTLKNALQKGVISHAYLFTGPRGVGKTSIARILAHELNQLEYSGEQTHLDIIEIDAASNRGIDEIRDLRDKVHMAPSQGKYKIYIIDEVHMLTTPAFNALLKTLEEPPAHVVFVLATTEVHKLPATIISRTQRYTFRPVEQQKVIDHLRYIATQEKIKVDDEALAVIAAHGEGSFRDSISLLDQAASRGDAITAETVREILGMPSDTAIQSLISLLGSTNRLEVVAQLTKLQDQGFQAGTISRQLAARLRHALIHNEPLPISSDATLQLLSALIDVPASNAPERLLEIHLLKTMPATVATATPEPIVSVPTPPATATKKHTAATQPAATDSPKQTAASEPLVTKKKSTPQATATASPAVDVVQVQDVTVTPQAPQSDVAVDVHEVWPQVLEAVKQQYNTVYGILRMAQPTLEGSTLVITFKYAFHQKRISEVKHRQILSDTLEKLTGQAIGIECRHDSGVTPFTASAAANPKNIIAASESSSVNPLATVSNIFGGGELLES